MPYLIHQRTLLFWNKIHEFNNVAIRSVCIVYNAIIASDNICDVCAVN